ncbi:MAG: hypothetical protein ABII64_06650 [Elusimicrobiota bacterium]
MDKTNTDNKSKNTFSGFIAFIPKLLKLFGLIIGTFAGIFLVYDRLLSPIEIKGKIISGYEITYKNEARSSLLKMSIFSKNHDFYLKDVNVYIKKPNSKCEQKCIVRCPRAYVIIDEFNGRKRYNALRNDKIEFINTFTVLPKNKAISGYLQFTDTNTANGPYYGKYEYAKIVFIDFNKKSYEIMFNSDKLYPEDNFYDDSIWKESSLNEFSKFLNQKEMSDLQRNGTFLK